MGHIKENVREILSGIPSHVNVVAAAKSRTLDEVREVIDAGITIIGENYLQDAKEIIAAIGAGATWHFTGHVQRNKVKHIVPLFDMIQTVDSLELSRMINDHAAKHGKVMPVLIEVNSAKESQKSGVLPEAVEDLIREISPLKNIRVQGLMTMGPFLDDMEGLRPYFRLTKELYDSLSKLDIPGVEMRHLSMGMSDSYLIAIKEGASLVRIGTKIFGPRESSR